MGGKKSRKRKQKGVFPRIFLGCLGWLVELIVRYCIPRFSLTVLDQKSGDAPCDHAPGPEFRRFAW